MEQSWVSGLVASSMGPSNNSTERKREETLVQHKLLNS